MASIEAIYIIDINGKVVLDYPTSPSPPSIHTLISYVINPESGAVLSASNETIRSNNPFNSQSLSSGSRKDTIQAPIIEISSSLLLFHQKYGNLVFLLPCASSTPALVPFEFIARLIETLESYLNPPLIPTKIESNFDLIALILSEMIDGGVPVYTEPDTVHGFVQPTGAITRLLSSATGSGSALPNQSISEIPWRRANVKHTNNELFVDIIETITAVIPPTRKSSGSALPSSSSAYYNGPTSFNGTKPLISRVDGSVFVSSQLSGIPEVSLVLNTGPHPIIYPSFHPCVRFERFENFDLDNSHKVQQQLADQQKMEKLQRQIRTKINANANDNTQNISTLSFIPPDGKFLLASYCLEDNVGLGLVQSDLRTGLGPKRDEFEVRVWTLMSKETKYIENLSVSIFSDSDRVSGLKTLRVTTGEFSTVDGSVANWSFADKTPLGWNATLRGFLIKNGKEDDDVESYENTYEKEVNLISFDSADHTASNKFVEGAAESEKANGSGADVSSAEVKKEKSKKKKKKTKSKKSSKEEEEEENNEATSNGSGSNSNARNTPDHLQHISSNHRSAPALIHDPSNTSVVLSSRKSPPANTTNNQQKNLPKPIFPTHVTISYKAVGQVPSGTKVKSLKINNTRGSTDSKSKIFKGVRYVTLTGDFVIR